MMETDESSKKSKNKEKKKKEQKKNELKREKGQCYYFLPYLCFKVRPCYSYRESPWFFTFIYYCEFLYYTTGLVYSDDELPQMLVVFMSKQVGWTPT